MVPDLRAADGARLDLDRADAVAGQGDGGARRASRSVLGGSPGGAGTMARSDYPARTTTARRDALRRVVSTAGPSTTIATAVVIARPVSKLPVDVMSV